MKYRMLRKNEKPDAAKGDQVRTQGLKRGEWVATRHRGERTVAECGCDGSLFVYRRPIAKEKGGKT